MEQKLFDETIPLEERKDNLEGICSSVEERTYHKPLTEEEAQEYKDLLTQTAIKQSLVQKEYDEVKAEFKDRLSPLKDQFSHYCDVLKNNGIPTTGKVYLVADAEENMMGYYDEKGVLISSRRLMPNERQNNLFISNFKKQSNE